MNENELTQEQIEEQLLDQMEMNEAQQEYYLKQLNNLQNSKKLSESEKESLKGILQEYQKFQQAYYGQLDLAEH